MENIFVICFSSEKTVVLYVCVCVCVCVCKLEKEMAICFSIFCLGNPMGEEPGGFAKSLT